MNISRLPNEYLRDTYDLRLLMLKKYANRCKIVMGGAAGLLFFTGSDLITSLEKVITVILVVAFIIPLGYSALLGFEDAIVDIEYKLKGNEKIGSEQARRTDWPKSDENRYHIAAIFTTLLALFLIACMIWNCFSTKKTGVNKIVKTYTTSTITFTVGPFVQGYDSLYLDSIKLKLNQLRDSLTKPKRNYTELNIYGGVDKRPLKGLSKSIFGDNITLAQSRAEWMKKQIIDFNCLSKSCQLVTSVVGAKKYSPKYTEDDYAFNRYVIINCKFQDSIQTNF